MPHSAENNWNEIFLWVLWDLLGGGLTLLPAIGNRLAPLVKKNLMKAERKRWNCVVIERHYGGGPTADAWPAFGDSKVHYISPSRMIHSENRYFSQAAREKVWEKESRQWRTEFRFSPLTALMVPALLFQSVFLYLVMSCSGRSCMLCWWWWWVQRTLTYHMPLKSLLCLHLI